MRISIHTAGTVPIGPRKHVAAVVGEFTVRKAVGDAIVAAGLGDEIPAPARGGDDPTPPATAGETGKKAGK